MSIIELFKEQIEEAVEHIASTVDEDLSKDAKEGLAKVFRDVFRYIAGNTLDGMCREIMARSSPFAAFDLSLCTREQIMEASDILMQELKAGKFGSALMPAKHNGLELSVLADTDSGYSSAPVVNGKSAGIAYGPVSVPKEEAGIQTKRHPVFDARRGDGVRRDTARPGPDGKVSGERAFCFIDT